MKVSTKYCSDGDSSSLLILICNGNLVLYTPGETYDVLGGV